MITSASPAPLALRGVSRSFGKHPVLQDISLTLPAGAVVGLIGDNGAGKTTLLRLASGILKPDAGEVRAFGFDPAVERHEALGRLGALIETPGHYDELTVRDNLRHWYGFYTMPEGVELEEQVGAALARFGLTEVESQSAGSLSAGYRRRLAVARAAHPSAELILLDEPLESLDPRARNDLKEVIRKLSDEGRTVFLSSHNLADIDTLCRTIWVIAARHLHSFGGFEEIRALVGSEGGQDLDGLYARLAARLEQGVSTQ